MDFSKCWIKSVICMEKRAYVGTSFVGRLCQNEMCVDSESANLTGLKWSCDIRLAHVWLCELFTIHGNHHIFEGQGVCQPVHTGLRHNACISRRGRILVYIMWKNEEWDYVVWVAPRLVWVCWNLQHPNATCQCIKEGLIGGNWTLCIFWRNKTFLVRLVEASRAVRRCHLRKVGRPGACIISVLVQWIHLDTAF